MEVNLESVKLILAVCGGVIMPIIFRYVKDQLTKNDLKNEDRAIYKEIESIYKSLDFQERTNRTQETSIQNLREKQIKIESDITTLDKQFYQIYKNQEKEINQMQGTLKEITKAVNGLNSTMQGMKQLIELKIK